jgi:hypothetical protein
MAKKSHDYEWCEVYGGPRDGFWCSTGNVSERKGQISFHDVDGVAHYYVLITAHTFNTAEKCFEPTKTFFAYAGDDPKKIWDRVIIGHPGCPANNDYDPDDEPDWYNPNND